MKLLIVGRSAHADVVIPDASVSAYHAEIMITADRRCHITDRASAQGTFHRTSVTEAWTSVRQNFVDMSDQLRHNKHVFLLLKYLLFLEFHRPDPSQQYYQSPSSYIFFV